MSRPSPRRRPDRSQSYRRAGGDPVVSPLDTATRSVGRVYAIPGYAILPLRLFMGITFLYAGIQKLNDPGFFTLGSTTYIGTQLLNFSHNSPIQFFLKPMLEHAVAFGWLTILTELAVGFAVLVGLFTRLAALVGLAVNFVLFLSASWSVYPYFLGSDIVFVAAWATLIVTGPGGYCLDSLLEGYLRGKLDPPLAALAVGPLHDTYPDPTPAVASREQVSWVQSPGMFSRRTALAAGVASLGLFILGVLPRPSFGSPGTVAAGSGGSAASGTSPTPGTAPGAAPTQPAGGTTSGKVIAKASQIPTNSALPFNDPTSGDPSVVVHLNSGSFVAYDAVCTHAGCTVEYDPSYKLLVCPCHGGAYDPAHGAQVVAGPPPTPLTSLPITVDANGNVILT